MKARRCFSLVLLALCASSFAAEPGAVTKRVVLPHSDAPEFTEPHRAAQQLFKELTEKMEAAAAAADAQGQQSAAQGEASQPL